MGGDEVEPLQKWMEQGQIFVDMGGGGDEICVTGEEGDKFG